MAAIFLLIGAGCEQQAKVSVNTDVQVEPIEDKAAPNETEPVGVVMQGGKAKILLNTGGTVPMDKPMAVGAADVMMDGKVTMKDGTTKMLKEGEKIMMDRGGTYEGYEASKLNLAKDGKVVLYFHAPWCPTCKTIETDINANIGKIPDNTNLLKVDYDSSTALKQKYGVTYQHTFVQVDAEGKLIKKWSGGATLDSILSQIQ